ncbi:MAG: type I-E CRISPR-associated protein Cas6/Cse3/CasE [Microvirga sp.]
MSLHMIQMSPDMGSVVRWAHAQGLLARRGSDDFGYAWHAILTAAFGEKAPRPFHLVERPGRPAQILAYSQSAASVMQEHAALYADPAVVDALALPDIVSKPMPAEFDAGARFGFALRVRPVIRITTDGKIRERDAYLAALAQVKDGETLDRGSVYTAWLAKKLAAGGATLVHATIARSQINRVVRRDRSESVSKLHALMGPDVTFNGDLVVQDPYAFRSLLARGVGRHRSFGFGMVLLRPAGQAPQAQPAGRDGSQ